MSATFIPSCESPAERRLLDAFVRFGFTTDVPAGCLRHALISGWEVCLYVQFEPHGTPHRLDFFLDSGTAWVAVEVDGHEWHERTKEQAARDRARDRSVLAAGITTIRFTGSEVHRDADSCVREAMSIISKVHA